MEGNAPAQKEGQKRVGGGGLFPHQRKGWGLKSERNQLLSDSVQAGKPYPGKPSQQTSRARPSPRADALFKFISPSWASNVPSEGNYLRAFSFPSGIVMASRYLIDRNSH